MPRMKARNKTTGEEVSFDWDDPNPPSTEDISRISSEQRDSRVATKQKIAAINTPSFTQRVLSSDAMGVGLGVADKLGLNQPWHPVDAMKGAWEGAKQLWSGEENLVGPKEAPGPLQGDNPANPRTAGFNKMAKGMMGAAGPPLTALGYAVAPLPTAAAMMTGNVAGEEAGRGMRGMGFSPEVSEAVGTGTGLLVGGKVGSMAAGPSGVGAPAPEVIPPETGIQVRQKIYGQPQGPPFDSMVHNMGTPSIEGRVAPFEPPSNARLALPPGNGAIPMPEAGTHAQDLRIQALAPEDASTGIRPEPISASEIPSVAPVATTPEVRSQGEQSPLPVEAPPAPEAVPEPVVAPPQTPAEIAASAIEKSRKVKDFTPPDNGGEQKAAIKDIEDKSGVTEYRGQDRRRITREEGGGVQPFKDPMVDAPSDQPTREAAIAAMADQGKTIKPDSELTRTALEMAGEDADVAPPKPKPEIGPVEPPDEDAQADLIKHTIAKNGTDIVRNGLDKVNPPKPGPVEAPEMATRNQLREANPQMLGKPVRPPLTSDIRSERSQPKPGQVLAPGETAAPNKPQAPRTSLPEPTPEATPDGPEKSSSTQTPDKFAEYVATQKGAKRRAKLESMLGEMKNVNSRIDELENKDTTRGEASELQQLYRKQAELEGKQGREMMPEEEKYGPRVANLRKVHAEATMSGLDHAALSQRAKADYGVDSMSKLNPEQLAEFEDTLKTERLEREEELNDLEGDEFDDKLDKGKKNRLKDLLKDTEGALNIKRGLAGLKGFFQETGGALRKEWTQSGETSLNRGGGEDLAKEVRNMRTEAEKSAGQLVSDYRANTKGLTESEFKNMIDVLQGSGRAMNPKVAAAARAENTRLTMIDGRLGGKTVAIDPLTSTRSDRALLSDYYDQASRVIQEHISFGDRGGKTNLPDDVRTELKRIKTTGGDYNTAYSVMQAVFNPHKLTEMEHALWDKMAGFEVATKLGQAVISNATQPANIAMITGNKTFLKTIAKRIINGTIDGMTPEEFGLKSGTTLSSVTHETQMTAGVKPEGFASQMLDKTGFSRVEVNNRIMAAMAGAEHAVNMFDKLKKNNNDAYARRHLSDWLGLDPDVLKNQSKLTTDDLLTAGHTLSDRTQFRTSPLEVPPSWGSSLGAKTVTLFKNFAFNQAKFTKDILTKEIAGGNMRPLIPLLTTVPILGYIADNMKKFFAGRKQAEGFWNHVIDSYSAVGGIGIVQDMAIAATYRKTANAVVGPIIGDILEGFEHVVNKDVKGLKKQAVRNIPVVGKTLANKGIVP